MTTQSAQYKKGYLDGYKDAEAAYGKCHLCYGKGYSTQIRNEVGAEDFRGEGYETGPEVRVRFCSCERGKQLKKLWGAKTATSINYGT